MNHSESIAKLAAALVKVQGEIEHAHKNATNPHFRNRYADLTEVIDTTRPVLAKHGLSVVQLPGYVEGITTLDTILLHESGEWISGTAGARVQKDDPQGVGSALTYLRRYSLAAVVGIGQEDDDAEAASAPARAPVQRMERPAPAQQSAPAHPASNGNGAALFAQELKFGKHKGKTWAWLIEHQPDYVAWALENMDRLAPDAKDLLRLALAERAMDPAKPALVPLSEPDDDMPF